MRRAAISVSANIAEGLKKRGIKDKLVPIPATHLQKNQNIIGISAVLGRNFSRSGLLETALNFYNIAQGSLEELRYYIILSRDLDYLDDNANLTDKIIDEISKMLYSLIKSIGGQR